MKLKNKNVKKFSMFNLFTITAGSMVGIGIFFKNQGVLNEAGSAWGAIIAWVVGIVAVLATAIAFFEIASSTKKESGTLSNWGKKFIGLKFGKIVALFYNYIWSPVLAVTLAFFTVYFAQFAMGVNFNTHELSHLIYIGGTILMFAIIYFANAITNEAAKWLQTVTLIIKFLPLLLVAIIGFANPAVASSEAAINIGGDSSMLLVILAVPGTLFALDTFLSGVALSKEEKNPGDAIKSTILSVLLVGGFYLVFAFAVFFGTSDGNIMSLITKLSNGSVVVERMVFLAITVSALGVLNGLTMSGIRNIETSHHEGYEFKKSFMDKRSKAGALVGPLNYYMAICAVWIVIMFIAGYAMGPVLDRGIVVAQGYEGFIDQFSNVAVIGGFFIYSIILIGGIANRFSKEVKVTKIKYFIPIATIAIVFNLTITFVVLTRFLFAPEGLVKYFIVVSIILLMLINLFNDKVLGKKK